MEQVLDIINQIAAVSSTKDKKAIISKHLPVNKLLQTVVKYALDQNKSYNITELVNTDVTISGDVFLCLDALAAKRGATDEEVRILSSMCHEPATWAIVTKIIQKDLKCGCGATTFNEIMPGLVYQVPYQRFSSFKAIDKVNFEEDTVVAQIKYDGQFAYAFPDDSMLSRNGSRYSLNGALHTSKEWTAEVGRDLLWKGETLVLGLDGKFLPRKTGNGIINKFISGKGDPQWQDRIRYVTWGYVTESDFARGYSDMTYEEMLQTILPFKDKIKGSKIQFSKTEFVCSKVAAMAFYQRARDRKEEGAMVKVANKLKWKDEDSGSKFGVKLKPVAEAEFEIVDAYYGDKKGKYAEVLGGLVVKTYDGKILTKFGGGFSDEERNLGVDWWKDKIGRVVTGKFTGITTDKSSRETFCLDHGNFVELRDDKTGADTYEYCVDAVARA